MSSGPEPDYFEQLYAILADIRARQGEELPPHLAAQIHEDARRAKIQALIEQGATEGEREAARSAMRRLDLEAEREEHERHMQDLRDEEEFGEAAAFGEA